VPNLEIDLALTYFDTCLIKPPVFPGTLSPDKYLLEIGYEFLGGFKDLELVSERVGEVIGSALVAVIIGQCINTVTQEKEACTKRDIRDLDKALEKVYEKKDKLIKSWPYQLNMNKTAVGAARNLNYLIQSGKPNVTLQSEMNASTLVTRYRFKCVSEFSPARLRELMIGEIVGLTGLDPTY
jgi:hypothetical protein